MGSRYRLSTHLVALSLYFAPQARCINAGTLTVNYEKVEVDYRLRHNDLIANIVHRYTGTAVLCVQALHVRTGTAKKIKT